MVVQNSTKFSSVIFTSLTLLMIRSSAMVHHLVCQIVSLCKLTVFQVSDSVPTVSNETNQGPCQNSLPEVSQKFACKLTLKPCMIIAMDFVVEIFQ